MVGLTDQNIHLSARIRVGEDFGRIQYMGPVSHHCLPEVSRLNNIFMFVFLRLKDMMVFGLELNGTTQ